MASPMRREKTEIPYLTRLEESICCCRLRVLPSSDSTYLWYLGSLSTYIPYLDDGGLYYLLATLFARLLLPLRTCFLAHLLPTITAPKVKPPIPDPDLPNSNPQYLSQCDEGSVPSGGSMNSLPTNASSKIQLQRHPSSIRENTTSLIFSMSSSSRLRCIPPSCPAPTA